MKIKPNSFQTKVIACVSVVVIFFFFVIILIPTKENKNAEIYLLYSKKTSSINVAKEESVIARAKGGGGAIFTYKGSYYVVLQGYSNANNAKIVKEKLKAEEVDILKLEIDVKDKNNSLIFSLSEKVYDLSVSFDKGKVSAEGVDSSLYLFKSEIAETLKNEQDVLKRAKLKTISAHLQKVIGLSEEVKGHELKALRLELIKSVIK